VEKNYISASEGGLRLFKREIPQSSNTQKERTANAWHGKGVEQTHESESEREREKKIMKDFGIKNFIFVTQIPTTSCIYIASRAFPSFETKTSVVKARQIFSTI